MNDQNKHTVNFRVLFDILHSDLLRPDHYDVILFFLSLYRDNVVKFLDFNYHMKNLISADIWNSENIRGGMYKNLYSYFEGSIRDISDDSVYRIFSFFNDRKADLITNQFSSLFDDALYTISDSQGKYASESLLPREVSQLMVSLAEIKRKGDVYNPFAGLASFSVLLSPDQAYSGEEINARTWALGMLRLFAYERVDVGNYKNEDSLWRGRMPVDEEIDYILSAPPSNLKLKKYPRGLQQDVRSVEQFLIENGLFSLSPTGKMVVLISMGFLFRSTRPEKNTREYIVSSGVLEKIVLLPSGLLSNTNIASAILVLNKAKTSDEVTFIDASKHISSKTGRKNRLEAERLLKDIRESSDSEIVRVVSSTQIEKNDYNLTVSRYFTKEYSGIKLSEILEPISGKQSRDKSGIKLVRIRDLKSDILDYELDLSTLGSKEGSVPAKRIEESCFLVATRWKALKPTYFSFAGEPIYISHDLLPLRIKTGKENGVSIPYLIHELNSELVNEQLDILRAGVVPMIRRSDLMQIKIVLPSVEEQEAKVKGLQEISSKIVNLEKERQNLEQGISQDTYHEFASLKHTLGRPRQNIIDWTDNILAFLNENKANIQELSDSFAAAYDLDMLAAIQEIKKDANFISDVLEKGENGLVLDEYSLTLISLSDINKLIRDISSNTYKFKINKMPLASKNLVERGISANPVLLNTLIENVLTNADKHGFKEKSKANEVVIELADNEDVLTLEIRNNGKRFPRNFDRETFITKFKTGNRKRGTGLGGYDIHRIATYFGDRDWELDLSDPIFPVRYIFRFPIKYSK